MPTIQEQADNLRREAQQVLYGLLQRDREPSGRDVNRFVECIIGSAMLELASMQSLPPVDQSTVALDNNGTVKQTGRVE